MPFQAPPFIAYDRHLGEALPEDYGARGDGVADDTPALKAWAASGLNLAMKPGSTYLARAVINITTPNITLDGSGAVLKRAAQIATTTTTTITSGVTTQITLASVAGLKVGDEIVVEQAGNYDQTPRFISVIQGNLVTVATAFGITLPPGTSNVRTSWTQLFVGADNVRVTNLTFDGNYANWTWGRWFVTCALTAGNNVTPYENILIDHCRFYSQPGDGIQPTGIVGCVVAFNDFLNINGRGISWSGSGLPGNDAGGRCIFNRFRSCELDSTVQQSDGVGNGDGNGAINLSSGILDLIVEGNQIDTSIEGIGSVNSAGNSNISIRNNVIRNTSSYAIEGVLVNTTPATNVVVTGNRIYSCGDMQITLGTGSGTGWIVRDNTFWETALNLSNIQQCAVTDNWFYSATVSGAGLTLLTLANNGAIGVQQATIARNQFFGGQFGISATQFDGELVISENQCINQYNTALYIQNASPNVSVVNNHAAAGSGCKSNWLGIDAYGAGVEVRANNVDATGAVGGWNGACIYMPGPTRAIVADNVCRLGANTGGTPLNVVAGSTNVFVTNNLFDATYTDAGTLTSKLGNIVNGGPVNGKVALVTGTKTISTPEVLTGDTILLSNVALGGTAGFLTVGAIVNKTSFVIQSSNAADTSTVYWEIRH